jgi:hypothetical protein
VAGVAVDIAEGLIDVDELGDALEVVEDEDAVALRKAEAGSDERGAGAEVGAFGSGFGIDFGGFGEAGVAGRLRGSVGSRFRLSAGLMFLVPFVGGGPVDEGFRDFFPVVALGREKADAVAVGFVFGDDLVRAVFENEALALDGGSGFGRMLREEGAGQSDGERERENGYRNGTPHASFSRLCLASNASH